MKYDVILFSPASIRFEYHPNQKRTLDLNNYQRASASHIIAAEARRNGYSVLVVDFAELWTWKEIKILLENAMGPDTVIGFSTTFSIKTPASDDIRDTDDNEQISDFANNHILKKFFKLFKHNKLVVGGPNAARYGMVFPEYVDHVIVGYGETQFMDLLKNQDNLLYPRVVQHDIEAKGPGFNFPTAPELWSPACHIDQQEPLHMELARGCPFKCKFCRYFMIGKKQDSLQFRTHDTLRDMFMYNYDNFGTTRYQFTDDTLNTSTEKLEHLNSVLKTLPFDILFWGYIRCDLLMTQPQQIELLKEMGLASCFMGVETFNRKAGRIIGKGSDPERVKDTLHAAKDCWKGDVTISQGYIAGLPGETIDDINESVEWLTTEDCPIDLCVMTALNIVPTEVLRLRGQETAASTFDKEYKKYGYEFPELERYLKPNQTFTELFEVPNWVKHDDTGLHSYHQTLHMVQTEWQPKLNKKLSCQKYPITAKSQQSSCGLAATDVRNNYIMPMLKDITEK